MISATVHILAELGPVVRDFYSGTGHERLAAGHVPVRRIMTFNTFEQLVDNMVSCTGQFLGDDVQVVVCHGRGIDGLLVYFATGTTHKATGRVIHDLAFLAKQTDPGAIDSDIISNIASFMGVGSATALRIAGKLATLRNLPLAAVEFRGCTLGTEPTILEGYKAAFGARRLTAPDTRMFYLRIKPKNGQSVSSLKGAASADPRTRRRYFDAPGWSNLQPIAIDVIDVDGHTTVGSKLFIDKPSDLVSIHRWAARLNGRQWRGAQDSFVLQVLWDNSGSSYSVPHDPHFPNRLVTV